ncbi:MAG: long-chain fatty acid--CoA ligase [Planctomycetota bacterium]
MIHETLARMFHAQSRTFGSRPLLFRKVDGQWLALTWTEVREAIEAWGKGLLALGLQPSDRVGILSENRPEWLIADLAVLSCRGVDVPFYTTHGASDIEYILRDAECRFLFVSGAPLLARIRPIIGRIPHLERVIVFDPVPDAEGPVLHVSGLAALASAREERLLALRLEEGRHDDLATIIYTSGTTGPPKGVMLTHGNILANCEAVQAHVPIGSNDRNLSFLPISHAFERTAGQYVFLFAGGEIAYAQSPATMAEDLLEVRPTVLLGVPRFYEKFHSRVMHTVARSRTLRRLLFAWGTSIGRRVFEKRDRAEGVPHHLRVRYAVARSFLFRKIHERTGGRIRFLVSGGAPLSPEIVEFFGSVGLTLLEGYGLTETAPVVSCNQLDSRRLGSVGKPLPGWQVKIGEDGEILVRGPSVMRGYYKRDSDTAAALDSQGFLRTGDIGFIDGDGFLFVTGRKKDLIITAGGKNISPQNIENRLQLHALIAQACLIGDRRPFLTALIVPDFETLRGTLSNTDESGLPAAQLIALAEVRERLRAAVSQTNADLAHHEQVRRFALLAEPFSPEGGELTPTLKLRRAVIAVRRAALIETLYAEDGAVSPPAGRIVVEQPVA